MSMFTITNTGDGVDVALKVKDRRVLNEALDRLSLLSKLPCEWAEKGRDAGLAVEALLNQMKGGHPKAAIVDDPAETGGAGQ